MKKRLLIVVAQCLPVNASVYVCMPVNGFDSHSGKDGSLHFYLVRFGNYKSVSLRRDGVELITLDCNYILLIPYNELTLID